MFTDLFFRLRSLLKRNSAELDLDDELRFHHEQQIEKYLKAGLTRSEARRKARLESGGLDQVKEECREARGVYFAETLVRDLGYGMRTLRKSPGFAAAAVLTLALGIGASTAIFSAVIPILFEPLPYPHADRILMIWYAGADGSRVDETFGTYRELEQRSRSYEAIAVMKPWQPTMTGHAQPERLDGQRVSASYFRVLGVSPALGRNFQAVDDQLKGPSVVILSDALWRRRFDGDPAIVGRLVTLDDSSFTVIGVMPRSFEDVLASSAELWSPLRYDMSLGTAWGHHLKMAARLRPGVGPDQAGRELDAIAHTRVPEFPRVPWASLEHGFIVHSLQDDVTRGVKPALLAVFGAVMLVLAIACVNVVNLLLARGAQRRSEFAMRAALGAGRARMIRQLLTESLLLAGFGSTLGIVVAELGVSALVALSPPGLPRAGAIGVDRTVFEFTLGVSTLIGLIVGLIPALQASRPDLHIGLQQGSRRSAGGHQWTRRMLVVTEVALALVLLAGAGLLLRSLQKLFAISPGFEASHLLTMKVQTSGRRFDKDTTDRFFAQSLEKVRHVPGIAAAAFTSQLPLSGEDDEYGARFEGDDPNTGYQVFRYAVSPGYFEAIGIPLRHGREFDARDVAGAPPVVVISESVSKEKFPSQDPIGRRVHIGPTNGPWYTIIGVVGDVKQLSLAANQPWAVYITTTQSWFVDDALSLVIRTHGEAANLASSIKQAIWSVDKDQPIVRIASMDELLAVTALERRFALILFEAFGIVALALAAVGIYGVLSASVTERRREIGVRLALGASPGKILALVVCQGMTLTGIGILIGLAGTAAASRALITLLFGVSRLDPMTHLGVAALLFGVAVIACWVPAWRAARVDASITLRAE